MAFIRDPNNLIPIMTSDVDPKGKVIYSTQFAGYYGWKAFSGQLLTWADAWINGVDNGWIGYDFGTARCVNQYRIYCETDNPLRVPAYWTFDGWNGVSWVVLDVQNNVTGWVDFVGKTFNIKNVSWYTKYRLNILSPEDGYVAVGKLEMMGLTSRSQPLNPQIYYQTQMESSYPMGQ